MRGARTILLSRRFFRMVMIVSRLITHALGRPSFLVSGTSTGRFRFREVTGATVSIARGLHTLHLAKAERLAFFSQLPEDWPTMISARRITRAPEREHGSCRRSSAISSSVSWDALCILLRKLGFSSVFFSDLKGSLEGATDKGTSSLSGPLARELYFSHKAERQANRLTF